jgi:hypothetical protein
MKAKRKAAVKEQRAAGEKSLQKINATTQVAKVGQSCAMAQVLAKALGLHDEVLAVRIVSQMSRVYALWPNGDAAGGLEIALTTMLEMKPESITEALLAVQMVGVHQAALTCLQRAALQGNSLDDLDAAARVTTRFMRLYLEQLEAMAKLKGKTGQQKVTVEHVHVHEGGQAIVGAVRANRSSQGGGGVSEKQTETP